ncbi:MAG: hypothetical protein FJY86_04000 [Candidatus Diapherotrites archaeon]|uniref:Uncharacterized protein n=1 Tax=Candidatus Iainarchaeum sp. TaxID=3101447 RepID=A0A8T4C7A3_9ARCH|nr:hypothetical protein [Candidatus Diapherotrites archaeon]
MRNDYTIGIIVLVVVAILLTTVFAGNNTGQVAGGTIKGESTPNRTIKTSVPNIMPVPGTTPVAFPEEQVFYPTDVETVFP